MNGVTIGLDLGSHGLRVAWASADHPAVRVDDFSPVLDQPWITAERVPATGELRFVSAKRQLSSDAVQRVAAEFAAARERVSSASGADIERAVLTVSSSVGSRDRTALRDAARGAGFPDAHLINASVAAVLASDDGAGAAHTVLVYSIGYSGFELGLVRMARRQVRVLGHAGNATPSGAQFDHWVLRAWLTALAERNKHGLASWTVPQWVALRCAAENAAHQLAVGEQVACRWPPWSADPVDGSQPTLITLAPDAFQQMLNEQLMTTRDRVRELLATADLTSQDVGTVLLIGGCTAIPAVTSMLTHEFGFAPQATGPGHLAVGAAVYGAQLHPTTAQPAYGSGFADAFDDDESATTLSVPLAPATGAGSVDGAGHAVAPQDTGRPDGLAEARWLLIDGHADQARTVLVDLIERAQQLLAEVDRAAEAITASTTKVPSVPDAASDAGPDATAEAQKWAQRAIQRARRRMDARRLAEAVHASHLAWERAPEDQTIFDQMIEIHLNAAHAASGPSRYEDARRWLGCARAHAHGDQKVLVVLVDRVCLHARYHYDQGQTEEALRLVEECLDLDPDHRGAQALRAEIPIERDS